VRMRGDYLTPDSPDRAIVREQMPLQASQKRISWSYEPVTRITDMSGRAGAADLVDRIGAGMSIVRTGQCWR
jgi:hypothetical protein